MDSDDISLPARFAKQVEFLEEHGEVDLLGTCAERIDENGKLLGVMSLPNDHDLLKDILKYSTAAYHPTWMFRRELIERYQGYRPFPVAQDYDFLWRIIDGGAKISNLKEILFHYRVSTENLSVKKFYSQWKIRKYIFSLHKERALGVEDSFSIEDINRILKINPLINFLSIKSQLFFERSVLAKRQGNKATFIFNLIISILIFPQKLEVLYSTYRSKSLLNSTEGSCSCEK
jgi:hypothetical protein